MHRDLGTERIAARWHGQAQFALEAREDLPFDARHGRVALLGLVALAGGTAGRRLWARGTAG